MHPRLQQKPIAQVAPFENDGFAGFELDNSRTFAGQSWEFGGVRRTDPHQRQEREERDNGAFHGSTASRPVLLPLRDLGLATALPGLC